MTAGRRGATLLVPALALVVATTALAAGCGVGSDTVPRRLSATTSTSTTMTPDPEGDAPAAIYFVQGERLVPVTRALGERDEQAVLESLLQQPPDPAEGPGLSSSIPTGTRLLGVRRDGPVLEVDLSEEFNGVIGPARQLAIGQMVMSETSLEGTGVTQLVFSIDGEPFRVTTSRGDVAMVSACDFASVLADPSSDDAELTAGQVANLELRRRELEQGCP